MDWTEKSEMQIVRDCIKAAYSEEKRKAYLPDPDPDIESYWSRHEGSFDMEEYGPENIMELSNRMQEYLSTDERQVMIPAAIEIMNYGDKIGMIPAGEDADDKDELDLDVPDYVYIF